MKIKICGLKELKNLGIENRISEFTHCISIGDPISEIPIELKNFSGKILRLQFADIDESLSLVEGLPKPEDLPKYAPNPDIIHKILEFSNILLIEKNPKILIHCAMGVSRSTATGLIILYLIYKDENKALVELLKLVNEPLPNTYMIGYPDEILGSKLYKIIPKII
ncbi:MAG: hypothetical protein SFU98_06315 [Leptospiraceae bacterium]|nr:hypothetical protein [Leptospiraceae bacterium]